MEYTLVVAAICVVIYVTAKLLIDEIDEIDMLDSIGVFN
jgi:Flp pilus assembly pilin Flp